LRPQKKCEHVAGTLTEVAKCFRVRPQTVREWRTLADPLPGRPGHFDLLECALWRIARLEQREGRHAEQSKKQQLEEVKLDLEIQKRQALLKQIQGNAVDVDQVTRLFERAISEHNAQASQLKDRLLNLLPEKMAQGERKRFVAAVDKAIGDLRTHLADAAEEWARGNAIE
jgi:hypothetical protein